MILILGPPNFLAEFQLFEFSSIQDSKSEETLHDADWLANVVYIIP